MHALEMLRVTVLNFDLFSGISTILYCIKLSSTFIEIFTAAVLYSLYNNIIDLLPVMIISLTLSWYLCSFIFFVIDACPESERLL